MQLSTDPRMQTYKITQYVSMVWRAPTCVTGLRLDTSRPSDSATLLMVAVLSGSTGLRLYSHTPAGCVWGGGEGGGRVARGECFVVLWQG
jgi:hypothetical protein